MVAPDDSHFFPEAERIVEDHERYWVVEKIGTAGAIARRADARV